MDEVKEHRRRKRLVSAGLAAVLTALLAAAASGEQRQPALHYCWPGILPRNLVFLVLVLLHGIRRLAPPY